MLVFAGKTRQSDSNTEVWYVCESAENATPPEHGGDASTARHYRETTFDGESDGDDDDDEMTRVVSETRQVSTLESITEEWCETMMQASAPTSQGRREWCETTI